MPSRRALVSAHQAHVSSISDRLTSGLLAGWDQLGYYDSTAADRFVPQAVASVGGAQRAAAAVTVAFIRSFTGKTIPAPRSTAVTGAAARLGASPAAVYRRPFETVWTSLSEGDDPPAAIAAGRDRLATTGRTDVTLAVRATTVAIGSTGAVAGWRRVAEPGACDLCSASDGEELEPDDSWAIHPNCGCTAEPIDSPPDRSDTPDAVAVHDHGEYGPYLAAAGDHFSGE